MNKNATVRMLQTNLWRDVNWDSGTSQNQCLIDNHKIIVPANLFLALTSRIASALLSVDGRNAEIPSAKGKIATAIIASP